ncbi:MAG: zinc ribbon domain-containing protein [Myxococcota bacterium]
MSGHHCPTCDIDVPAEARLCPQCGYVFRRAGSIAGAAGRRRLLKLGGVLLVLLAIAVAVWIGR